MSETPVTAEHTEHTERKKRTVDIGVATIIAALITAVGAITTVLLATLLPHVTASSPGPVPTVTVTKFASAAVTTTPAPVVTVTVHPATNAFGKGTSGWETVAASVTGIFGLGTLLLGGAILYWRRAAAARYEVGGVSFASALLDSARLPKLSQIDEPDDADS